MNSRMPPPPPASSGPKDVQTVMPSAIDAGKSITVSDFKITTRKLPILNAQEIDAMTEKLGIAPPEMIFGNNLVAIERVGSERPEADGSEPWKIEFHALDALDLVDKTGTDMLKVAYSGEWQKQREKMHEGIKEVVKPFDWTYSTAYKGSLSNSPYKFEATNDQIPLDKLRRQDPILFFDDVMLYEDELADNGMSILSVKIRVMPARLLLLARFYMRLDDVVFRIRDTRVFVEFADKIILREHQEREDSYDRVKQKLAPYRDDIPAIMRDPNQMVEFLPLRSVNTEKLVL